MDFCSKYIFTPKRSAETEEEVLEDELAQGWTESAQFVEEAHELAPPAGSTPASLSVPSDSAQVPSAPSKRVYKKKVAFSGTTQTYRTQVDTNVVAVKLASLNNGAEIHTGDCVTCADCHAVFSVISKIEEGIWNCEFCKHANPCDLVPQELPTTDTVDFIVQPAPQHAVEEDEVNIIFCVDISGSMSERAQKYKPNMPRDVQNATRLHCMQGAVDSQLRSMSERNPRRHVGLVTFNNEVHLIGDGTQPVVHIGGDRLNNYDNMVEFVNQHTNLLSQNIQNSAQALSGQLFQLEENGATALGPALLSSIVLASQRPGSRVVLCTDGLANVGLGSFKQPSTEELISAAEQFYVQLAAFAKTHGVVVSVISIEGAECKLENIGQVVEATGGSVDKVDPLTLTENFQSVLGKPLIATHVSVSMQLHSAMYFRNEPQVSSLSTKELGSVTDEAEVSFEFAIRPELLQQQAQAPQQQPQQQQPQQQQPQQPTSEAGELAPSAKLPEEEDAVVSATQAEEPATATTIPPPVPATTLPPSLPFQLRISYTKPNGMKCMRVVTNSKPVTADRSQAEIDANLDIAAANAKRQCAMMAQSGDYERSRVTSYAWRNMMGRVASSDTPSQPQQQQQFSTYLTSMQHFDDQLSTESTRTAQVKSSSASRVSTMPATFNVSQEQCQVRSRARQDNLSTVIMKMKK